MQVSEEEDSMQFHWIQYPSNRHTKLENEFPRIFASVHARASVPALVHTFPVDENHSIVANWNEIASQIIDKLNEADLKWIAVECFNRRQLDEESRLKDNTTVVITLSKLPARTESLNVVLEDIHKLSGGLWVELLEGEISLHGAGDSGIGIAIPYAQEPPMGSSIGPLNASRTGTLGGVLELHKEDEPVVKCALTCNHVVRPYSEEIPPRELDFFPIKPGDKNHPPIFIGYPSSKDHDNTIALQKKFLKSCRQQEQTWISKLQVDENSRTPKALDSMREAIARYERNIAFIETADRNIGQVFAASGITLASSQQCRLDWALISLLPERTDVSKIPFYSSTAYATSCLDINLGMAVRKKGSKTHSTAGQVNQVESFIAYEGTAHEMVSKEFVIVCEECPFAGPGDSGAFILDGSQQVVGLYWGSVKTKLPICSHRFYFTPIKAVVEHIEEITGYQVRLPSIDQGEGDA